MESESVAADYYEYEEQPAKVKVFVARLIDVGATLLTLIIPDDVSSVRSAVIGMSDGKITSMRHPASTGKSNVKKIDPIDNSPTVYMLSSLPITAPESVAQSVTCKVITILAIELESI